MKNPTRRAQKELARQQKQLQRQSETRRKKGYIPTDKVDAWEDTAGYLHPTDEPGDGPSIAEEFNNSGVTTESWRKRI